MTAHPFISAPAKPIRKRLAPEKRQAQLLDCAITAFAVSGIERAVHADVAELAKVSTPTVFKYFPSRDALVEGVLDEAERRVLELVAAVPKATETDPRDRVKALAMAVDHLCTGSPDLIKVMLSWSVAFTAVRPRYLEFQDKCLSLLQQRVSSAQGDRTDARILLGASFLFMQMHFDKSEPEVRDRFVARMGDLISLNA